MRDLAVAAVSELSSIGWRRPSRRRRVLAIAGTSLLAVALCSCGGQNADDQAGTVGRLVLPHAEESTPEATGPEFDDQQGAGQSTDLGYDAEALTESISGKLVGIQRDESISVEDAVRRLGSGDMPINPGILFVGGKPLSSGIETIASLDAAGEAFLVVSGQPDPDNKRNVPNEVLVVVVAENGSMWCSQSGEGQAAPC